MNVTFSLDERSVGWIVFDAPGARANVLDERTRADLAASLDAAFASPAIAFVIVGAKERIFIAGADLKALETLADRAAAERFSRDGQALLGRIAASARPVVCAIHGACAGGGYELALACTWRMASDDTVTQIGLPETSIGTVPGWGGCVRLPRLIGSDAAIDHIVRGQLVDAPAALSRGLVDECVPAIELRARALQAAQRLAREGAPLRTAPAAPKMDIPALRRQVLARTQGLQPAPVAAIELVCSTWTLPIAEALDHEARAFAEVTTTDACRNLIHAFFLRDAAKKRTLEGWFATPTVAKGDALRRVGVVGAGVMGSGIAHWLAVHGYEVVLRDVTPEFVQRGLDVVNSLVADSAKRAKASAPSADRVLARIATTTAWDGFDDCDVVIEAIVEDVAAKRRLFSELAGVVRRDALLASNTSALPIEEIAGHVPHPERTLGIHFFNPVGRMPLVEMILGPATDATAAGRALALIKSLGKAPVICRSSPGFLVTRVLFFYLNAAVRAWEHGMDAIALDAALRRFGWPMGPLRLIDEVGVDVTAFIFSEMARYFPGRFVPTTACSQMTAAGLKGRKNGASRGFYNYSQAGETTNEAEVRRTVVGLRSGASLEDPVGQLMAVMVDEAERCLAEGVVRTPEDVDFAMLAGAGFPAARGGLLRWARTSGRVAVA